MSTLKDIQAHGNTESSSFFPNCFDCSKEEDFNDFIVYYKVLKAECILKNFLHLGYKNLRDTEEYKKLEKIVLVALNVTRRRLSNLEEILDTKVIHEPVSKKEWSVLSQGEVANISDLFSKNKDVFSNNIRRMNKKNYIKRARHTKTSAIEVDLDLKVSSEDTTAPLNLFEQEVKNMLNLVEEKFPQTTMNGRGNIWIMKPAGLSRGRGICLYSNINDIINRLKSTDIPWVLQKYMENPFLINKKKMDIRQWVLITSINPLTVWFYDECYIRISTNEFTLKNIKNRFIHLTNNSVNKKSKDFVKEDGFMSQGDFISYLHKKHPEGSWETIQQQMKKQVKMSMLCAQDKVPQLKRGGEILGFDFCIDEKLNVWLIEVNSSPDFSFSSTVTEKLVRKASEDYLKVVLDYSRASHKKRKLVDTGMFHQIYRAKRMIKKATDILGIKFEVEGRRFNLKKFGGFFKKEDRLFLSKNLR